MSSTIEKETIEEPQQPSRTASQDLGEQGPSAEIDSEKNAHADVRLTLSRTVSGPPYTIFNQHTKMFIVLSVSVCSLISPFGATTFYPALNVLAAELNVTPSLINLGLTTYMVRPLR